MVGPMTFDGSASPADPTTMAAAALTGELTRLDYALQSRTTRNAWGSAAAADTEFRALWLRKHAIVRELRSRARAGGSPLAEADSSLPVEALLPEPSPDTASPPTMEVAVEQVKLDLVTHTLIGQAQGILVERLAITADEALERLASASRSTGRTMATTAHDLVASGRLDGPSETTEDHGPG